MSHRTFQEAVNFAVSREAEAAGFYELYGRKAVKPSTRAMFAELAAEEKKHQELLAGISPQQLKACSAGIVPEALLVPSATRVSFQPDMDFVDALRLAIEREDESIKLYQALEQEASDRVVRKLFNNLVEQEKAHRVRLQDELDSIVLKDY